MNRQNRLLKALMAASLLLGADVAVTTANAAQADIDLLKSYIGEWRGRGTTTNASGTETVVCKLAIKSADTTKVNYDGRCSLAGGNLAIKGTMAYIAENNRYEAVMSSNTSFSGVAVGRRRGQSVAFQLRNRNAEDGEEYKVDAGIALRSGDIEIDFAITEVSSGNKITANVPFAK